MEKNRAKYTVHPCGTRCTTSEKSSEDMRMISGYVTTFERVDAPQKFAYDERGRKARAVHDEYIQRLLEAPTAPSNFLLAIALL